MVFSFSLVPDSLEPKFTNWTLKFMTWQKTKSSLLFSVQQKRPLNTQTIARTCFSWGLSASSMASSAPPNSAPGVPNPNRSLGFLRNAIKHKDSFIQFFAMTGILLLSVRSLGQKYRIGDLQEDASALKEEKEKLTERMKNIKRDLLQEASLEPTGLFASRLRLLFGEEN